jgi:PAS domain-containing protein
MCRASLRYEPEGRRAYRRGVGVVASWAISDETVLAIWRRRETGSRLEVDRPLGEMFKWTSEDHCGAPRFPFVGHGVESWQDPCIIRYWRVILLYQIGRGRVYLREEPRVFTSCSVTSVS